MIYLFDFMKVPNQISVLAFLLFALNGLSLGAQEIPDARDNFKKHIVYLSSDEMRGRATGSPEEMASAKYIISELQEMGIDGRSEFLQEFEFDGGRWPTPNNFLYINGDKFEIEDDYILIPESSNGVIKGKTVDVGYGIVAEKIGCDDYEDAGKVKGKVLVMRWGAPEGNNPHSKYFAYSGIDQKVKTAKEKGAIGIIFINQLRDVEDPIAEYGGTIQTLDLPMVFLNQKAYARIKNPGKFKVELKAEFRHLKKKANNVIGYLDNGADYTVVIGGHYDHLGLGESGGSLATTHSQVHNGADDNASGVAMILELMRYLKGSEYDDYNYVAAFFTGEELGLFGSKIYANKPAVAMDKTNYMLNFDMVGRLDPDEPTLAINGVGTSSAWDRLADETEFFQVKKTESGIGPSDHTSFYLKDVPAIHFFTGAHNDYHKPSDDESKINYGGMQVLYEYVIALIQDLDDEEKIDFKKTKEESRKGSKFTVTLGVMPDYMFDGTGMRIDGVSGEKPAEIAGLLAGDVIIRLGEVDVKDIYSYMDALSTYKVGDTAEVAVLRGEETVVTEVTFF